MFFFKYFDLKSTKYAEKLVALPPPQDDVHTGSGSAAFIRLGKWGRGDV
jgi:hypothetical protein